MLVSKQYGWLDIANLGVQMHQSAQQAMMGQQLTSQTNMMHQESQMKQQIVSARQYLVDCEERLKKSEIVWDRYPYYAIWMMEELANGFRRSNLNSVFSEIDDLRASNDLQRELDNKVRELHEKTNQSEDPVAEIRNASSILERFSDPYNRLIRNRELVAGEADSALFKRIKGQKQEHEDLQNQRGRNLALILVMSIFFALMSAEGGPIFVGSAVVSLLATILLFSSQHDINFIPEEVKRYNELIVNEEETRINKQEISNFIDLSEEVSNEAELENLFISNQQTISKYFPSNQADVI